MKRFEVWIFLGTIAVTACSCSFSRDKGYTSPDTAANLSGIDPSFLNSAGEPVVPTGKYPGYGSVQALIFKPHCEGCHSSSVSASRGGNVSLDTYDGAKSRLADIYQEVVATHDMPLGGSLSDAGRAFVKAWYEAGGPQNDIATGSTPAPIPTSQPVTQPIAQPITPDPAYFGADGKTVIIPSGRTPGYGTVYALIFYPNCVKCHNINHGSGGVKLDDYSAAFSSMSVIYNQVEAGDMPPPYAHEDPISSDRVALLKAWVDAGGPENDALDP
jgi:mono/diheme cytochrome c family protein